MNLPVIPGEGPLTSKMAFIGEAPGREEVIVGRPFSGHAGNILNTKLHLCGLNRSEIYIDNVVQLRPVHAHEDADSLGIKLKKPLNDNDFTIFWAGKVPTLYLKNARDALLQRLGQMPNLNIVVALGAQAMWALTGMAKIGKVRGSIYQITLPNGRKVKVIGTYHPAAVLRQWIFGATVGTDFMKAMNHSESNIFTPPERELIIRPSMNQITEFIAERSEHMQVAFDIEIAMTEPTILCISLAYTKDKAISIPTTVSYWGSYHQLHEVLKMIEELLTDDTLVKVGQNMTFDIQWLARGFGIIPSKPWFDTMVAQHTCYSELPKGLDYLASIYTDEPYYKDELKIWQTEKSSMDMLWTYNCKDSAVTMEVYHELKKELVDLKGESTFKYMMELLEPLMYMMLKGINTDRAKVEEYREMFTENLELSTDKFSDKFEGINPNSPKQLMELAYDKLGLQPVKKRNSKGEFVPTMDEKAIEKLSKVSPELREVLEIRKNRKMLSTYVEMPVDEIDGRLRYSMNATGTDSGRLSSSNSVFGSGGNMQNIPVRIRDIFIADEGKVITAADLKGAEAQDMAYLTEDVNLIKLFESGRNIHEYNSKLIYDNEGVSDEDWTRIIKEDKKKCEDEGREPDSMYYKTKKSVHLCNYKGSWKAVKDTINCTAQEAKYIIQRYYSRNPNLTRYHYEIGEQLKLNRTITTPLGRRRIFFDRYGETLLRSAVSFQPQETVAQVINKGIINFYEDVCRKNKSVDILLQVHDEMVCQHPPEMTEFIHDKIKEHLTIPVMIKGRECTIPVDIKTGKNWKETKE